MTQDSNQTPPIPFDPDEPGPNRMRIGWQDVIICLLLLAGCAAMYLPDLTDRGPWTAGEARVVLTPRIMLERGDYIAMRMPVEELEIRNDQGIPIIDDSIRGKALRDQLTPVPVDDAGNIKPRDYDWEQRITIHKPVGYYWMVVALAKIGVPVNLLTARLTSSVSAILLVILVYWMGAFMFSRRAGLIAAVALATSVHFIWIARVAKLDMVLTLLLTAIFALFYLAMTTRHRFVSSLGMYVLLGLAFLLKGPGYLGVPVLIMLLYVAADLYRRSASDYWHGLVERSAWAASWIARWRFVKAYLGSFWKHARRMHLLVGILIIFGIALPWFVMIHIRTGGQYTDVMFLRHHLSRFGVYEYGKEFEAKTHWTYYLVTMWMLLFPWIIFLPGSVVEVFRKRSKHLLGPNLYLLVWFGFMLVFFSMMTFRKDEYLMPAYPAIALLIGMMLDQYLTGRKLAREPGGPRDIWLHRAICGAYLFIAGCGLAVLGFAAYMRWPGALDFYARFDDNANSLTHMRVLGEFVRNHTGALIGGGAAVLALLVIAIVAQLARRARLALVLLAMGAGMVTTISIHVLMDRFDEYRSQKQFAEKLVDLADPGNDAKGEPGDAIVIFGHEDHELVYWLDRLGLERKSRTDAWRACFAWPLDMGEGVERDRGAMDVLLGQFLAWTRDGRRVFLVVRDEMAEEWPLVGQNGPFQVVLSPDQVGGSYTQHRKPLAVLKFTGGGAGGIPASQPADIPR